VDEFISNSYQPVTKPATTLQLGWVSYLLFPDSFRAVTKRLPGLPQCSQISGGNYQAVNVKHTHTHIGIHDLGVRYLLLPLQVKVTAW